MLAGICCFSPIGAWHVLASGTAPVATLDPPVGALATCEFGVNGEEITGLRTQWRDGSPFLQCNPAWKRDAAGARRVASELRKDQPGSGEALACANLLLGADTLKAADTAFEAARLPGDAPKAAVMRALKAGARYGLATAADCKPSGFSETIPDKVWDDMQGKSWHPDAGCPQRGDLAMLHIPYLDFEGRTRFGEMVVARAVAAEVLAAFAQIYAAGTFPIASMRRVDAFGGSDLASMEANNSSAFNCRFVRDTSILSEHGKGLAVDINPVENPYVGPALVQPDAGVRFRERNANIPGMIHEGDIAVEAFRRIGWGWGGAWVQSHDYQHFSQSGR